MTDNTDRLLQDASRPMFDALAGKPDALLHAREAAAAIAAERVAAVPATCEPSLWIAFGARGDSIRFWTANKQHAALWTLDTGEPTHPYYSAAPVAAVPAAWQPIETAPTDGREALVYRPLAEKSGDTPLTIKRLIGGNRGFWDSTVPDGATPTNPTDGYCHTTHWMPLPAAPGAVAAVPAERVAAVPAEPVAWREAARQALMALEDIKPQNMGRLVHPAITALREALGIDAAPQPVPSQMLDKEQWQAAHACGFVEASKILGAEIERLRAEVAAAWSAQPVPPVPAEPRRWYASLEPAQRPQQPKSSMHEVGFRDKRTAQNFIDSELTFGGWNYTLHALYDAPQPEVAPPAVPAPAVNQELLDTLKMLVECASYGPVSDEADAWIDARAAITRAESEAAPVPLTLPWVPMHERAPEPGTECVVIVRYTMEGPAFATVDKWDEQHEDPTGMGGPSISTGYGWNDNWECDVIAWLSIPPHPPADWDQRITGGATGGSK